jgi:hypothetical protein
MAKSRTSFNKGNLKALKHGVFSESDLPPAKQAHSKKKNKIQNTTF